MAIKGQTNEAQSKLRDDLAAAAAALILSGATLAGTGTATAEAVEEAMMWNKAAAGTRFGVLCEIVATYGGEDGADFRAASYLKDWVDMGNLAGFQLG